MVAICKITARWILTTPKETLITRLLAYNYQLWRPQCQINNSSCVSSAVLSHKNCINKTVELLSKTKIIMAPLPGAKIGKINCDTYMKDPRKVIIKLRHRKLYQPSNSTYLLCSKGLIYVVEAGNIIA